MDNKLLLAKSITLLYQESKLQDKTENSADLIRTVLENVQVSEVGVGLSTTREVILALKTTILEMCDNPLDHEYDKLELLQRIRINTGDDTKLHEAIELGLDDSLTIEQANKTIINIQKSIHNHFREQQIAVILNKASYSFKFEREKIKDVNVFLSDLQTQLEPLQMNNTYKDPAVLSHVDIGDDGSMRKMFKDVIDINEGSNKYQTGWQDVNTMLGGGIMPGSCTVINALGHNFKTGFSLSVFSDIALYNKPLTQDINKKPLLLHISFEDDVESNIQFIFQRLKFQETYEYVDISQYTDEEMSTYVKTRLSVNGFHVHFLKVDPHQWTYKSICNKVIELSALSFNVEVLMVDYLFKVPTVGCTTTGPMGSDVCDIFSRMRSFCSGKRIAFITPHQLSTESLNLLRNGLAPADFVKEVNGKNYYQGTKALYNVIDAELYVHVVKHNKEAYLAVQRGKLRTRIIIGEEDKYRLYKFPGKMPIPADINTENAGIKKLTSAASNAADELFNIG